MCNKDNDFKLDDNVGTDNRQVEMSNVPKYKGRTCKSIDEMRIIGDGVNTIQNDEATILYIAAMIGGSIFSDRILIWIAATIMYFWHITRFKRRK